VHIDLVGIREPLQQDVSHLHGSSNYAATDPLINIDARRFELTDNLGRKLFEVTATRTNFYVPTILTVFVLYTQCISITLVCDDCLLTDYPERYESRAFEPASLCTISIIFRDG